MKTFIPTFFLLLIFSSPVICQTSLSGKISDGDTGEELIASNITLYKNGVLITGTTTDFEGNYTANIDPGTYNVEVSYVGYSPSRCNGVIVRAGMNNKLDMSLGGSGGFFQQRNFPKRKRKQKYGFEFQVPEEGDVIREVLDNKPELE